MKRKISIFIILTYWINFSFGQICPDYMTSEDCQKGIIITVHHFDAKISNIQQKLKNKTGLGVIDYIDLARFYNTVSEMDSLTKVKYSSFLELYDDNLPAKMIMALEGEYVKGGALWSDKHKILIGGWKHYNSYYKIVDEDIKKP